MAISFKGAHFPPEVILMGVRWYLAEGVSQVWMRCEMHYLNSWRLNT